MSLVAVKTMRFSVKNNLLKWYFRYKKWSKSGNDDSNIASKGSKLHTDFCWKNDIGFF